MFGAWEQLKRVWARGNAAPAPPRLAAPLPLLVATRWTPEHQKALYAFLGTPAGLCLSQRMNCVAAANAKAGAQDAMHAAHSAGRSAGFYDAIEWLDSQARIEFEQETLSGADADQSALSTHQLHGEAELRERYSP